MIISQEYILAQLREHPNGCTISDLIDMKDHPFCDRSSIAQNYRDKLLKLFRRGYVTRTGMGTHGSPYVWSAVE